MPQPKLETRRRTDNPSGKVSEPKRTPAAAPTRQQQLLALQQNVGNRAFGRLIGAGRSLGGVNLEAAGAGGDQEGPVGAFYRKRTFKLPDGKSTGVILQHVTRVFDVDLIQNNHATLTPGKMSNANIDTYVTSSTSHAHATDNDYWEAWDAPSAGLYDEFQLCGIKPPGTRLWNTTKGNFTIKGVASFYDGISAANLGLTTAAVGVAGVLPSSKAQPANLGAHATKKYGADVTYTVKSVWNTTRAGSKPGAGESYYSTVT